MEPPPTQKLPSRLRGYSAALQKISLRTGTSFTSLAVSFAVLHEVTAIVPLVGIYWGAQAFGIGDKMTKYFTETNASHDANEAQGTHDGAPVSSGGKFNETLRRWSAEGEQRVARVGARYGILGFEKGQKVTEEDMKALGGRVASEVANGAFAYMVVKALLPVRIGASLYLSPAFARGVLQPITRSLGRLMRR